MSTGQTSCPQASNPWSPAPRARAPTELMKPIVDPAGWYPEDLKGTDAWIYRLSAEEIAEVEAAVAGIEARGLELRDVGKDDFPLPTLLLGLAEIRDEIVNGRGFAVIRGLPVDGRSRFQAAAAFWGIAAHVGRAISQNGKGHLLGHVKDMGRRLDDPTTRAYHTDEALAFHCDRCDILSLCCVQPAKAGGEHRICSSVSIYNEMLKRRPDLAETLTFRFYRSRRGEIPPGETEPWVRQPVFSIKDGYFAARGAGGTILRTQKLPGVPRLTETQLEAIRMFEALAQELALDIEFEKGDISFVLNHVTQHARTKVDDWLEPERKRHLLRLWLDTGGARPLEESVAREIKGIVLEGTALQTPLEAV